MVKPMTEKNYNKLSNKITKSIKIVAEISMKSAATEFANKDGNVTVVAVSVDGTWQKRGLSSLNVVVAAISAETGKVVDCEVMACYCKACKLNKQMKPTDPQAYAAWLATHNRNLNYHGSAPKMETTGIIEQNNPRDS